MVSPPDRNSETYPLAAIATTIETLGPTGTGVSGARTVGADRVEFMKSRNAGCCRCSTTSYSGKDRKRAESKKLRLCESWRIKRGWLKGRDA